MDTYSMGYSTGAYVDMPIGQRVFLAQFDTIKECVEIACSILPNVNIKFAMTTNAVLLDKHIDYLIMHDFDICISLDGNKANNQY